MSNQPIWFAAAACNAIASLLHLAIIAGGAPWYRFFGAGERFARAAELGSHYPAAITFAISAMLALWAAYALAAAGVLPQLPFMRIALLMISAVYLLRGMVLLLLLLPSTRATLLAAYSVNFICYSSAICLLFAGLHLLGLYCTWSQLA